MSPDLFDVSEIPPPDVLRRRHLALVLIDECLAGRDGRFRLFQRRTSTAGGELLWFEDGSGNEYGLVVVDHQAVFWVFDHEAPYSPWIHDDDPQDWPGMLDGLPPALEVHLPAPVAGQPRSITGCYWHTSGRWHMGRPEPTDEDPGPYASDPQGVGALIAPLLDLAGAGVHDLVVDYYEQPERLDAAAAVASAVDAARPLKEALVAALDPHDGIRVMHERAAELGLASLPEQAG